VFDLSLTTFLVISIAGVVTGIINGVVGGGSLVSYLALVTSGVPPALAASTNTVGVLSGNPSALIQPFLNKQIQFRAWIFFALATSLGSLLGGVLLITLSDKIFEAIVPLLLIVSGVSVWIQPKRKNSYSRLTLPLLFASGIYNGYFGPGQGILNLSILYRGTPLEIRSLVILKNYIITASNLTVSILFISTQQVEWIAIPLLLVSVGLGGWLSQSVAGRLSETKIRVLLSTLAGIAAAYFVAF